MRRHFLLLVSCGFLVATQGRAESSGKDLCKTKFEGFQTALAQNPSDSLQWEQYRVCMNELKRWNDGALFAGDILQKNPDVWQAHLVLGITQLHSKDYDKAVASFENATRLKNDQAAPYYYLAMAYLFQARSTEASHAAANAAELEPSNAMYHSQLAYALLLTDERERCEAEAKMAIQLDKNNVAAYKVLGNLYKKLGKQDASDKAFDEAMHANARLTGTALPTGKKLAALPGMATAPANASKKEAASEPPEEDSHGAGVVIAYCRDQWHSMLDAILRGDSERALSYFTDYAGTREQYHKAFEALGPLKLKQMFSGFGELYDCQVVLGVATCKAAVTTNRDGIVQSSEQTIRFERNPDKVWRIRSF